MEKESYPWSLETTRRGYKVNMAAMEEGKIDIVVKLKWEQRKGWTTKIIPQKIAYVSD